jgi:hypothetical protein
LLAIYQNFHVDIGGRVPEIGRSCAGNATGLRCL